jgi:hypothetical protein
VVVIDLWPSQRETSEIGTPSASAVLANVYRKSWKVVSAGSPAAVIAGFQIVVDPTKFDFYMMDCYRHLAEDRLAETLATEVIQASTDFDGTERAPMRLAEARITLGVIAERQGDLEQAIHYGAQSLSTPRKSLPSLLMVSRDLVKVLNSQHPKEPETQAYLDQLHALNSLSDS